MIVELLSPVCIPNVSPIFSANGIVVKSLCCYNASVRSLLRVFEQWEKALAFQMGRFLEIAEVN